MNHTTTGVRLRLAPMAICLSFLLTLSAPVAAVTDAYLEFDLQLLELNLSLNGVAPIPLASDPGNALGDSVSGYGFVDSHVSLTLSSQRSGIPGPPTHGSAFAVSGSPASQDILAINPSDLNGQSFNVNSFFDVFFDITLTDVDSRPGRDYAGQPDGASVLLADNGPAQIQSSHQAIFDVDAPNFGLLPAPESDPFVGFFDIEIPLGGDINGNGEADKMKFTLALLSANDDNRVFIELPDGTVISQFETGATLEGAIVDVSTDPPFLIGAMLNGLPDPGVFGGPTTASSQLLNSVVPVPAAVWLFGTALVGFVGISRRRKIA